MAQKEDKLKDIISHAKEYGFIFPSSEIYDGLSATYDYGQIGSELKNNIKSYWWKSMVQIHENIVGIDSAIFMHPNIWKASGHTDAFNDPLIDNKDSKKRYRADILIEDHIEKIHKKINKEILKGKKRFGDNFNETKFKQTNPNIIRHLSAINAVENRMKKNLEENNLEEIYNLIVDLEISCPISGSKNWTEVRQFNLMFSTEMGSVEGESAKIYLRPETAQGIFVNFSNVQKTGRMKIPFGIAQIGKAFRNEIIARQFIFRMREFEQMEMQFFIPPGEEKKWYKYWKEERIKWHYKLGLGEENYRFHDHIKLAHYADNACDIEFKFPMGFKELEGIHSRTDFDLKQHEKFSGKKLQYFDPKLNQNYVPYVIETSIGLDRLFLAILSSSLKTEKLNDGSNRILLSLPPALSPYKAAIMPLTRKDGLPEKAKRIFNELKFKFNCIYDEKDSPGKRYRRQDAIGTPHSIMIDHQTLEDESVTIRNRDTMLQERVQIKCIEEIITKYSMAELLK
ncbi:MAG: glycine--tRNA ligase [Crocinitomicaceae bacterium]|nr:glycine--tRNA ligase [Crocinitomicaceae bacterium]|tara:strand:- start:3127 stop:4659 length:1533 start_codon:yes stop_codon:yes gene_type:complete